MSEQSRSYGEGRPDVEAAMRRATRTSRPTRRVTPVRADRPEQPFRPRARPAVARAPADTQTRGKINLGEGPVIPVALIGIGMYLAWFGVHYWRSDVKYPTDPLKAVLQGQGLPSNAGTPTADEEAVLKAAQAEITANQGVTPGTGEANPNATGQAVASGASGAVSATGGTNQATGKLLAAAYGWSTGQQWDDLVSLWDRESGWDNTIWNGGSHAATQPAGSSGAYGIAQSLPYSKYPKAGWPPGYGGSADPTSQISWGLSYIQNRYGSPSAAWAHETSQGWY